jgi:PAS domain S-box-containing protein
MLKTKIALVNPPEVVSAEDALAHLSALVESTQDLVWSVDLEYKLLTFNNALSECLLKSYGIFASDGSRVHDQLPPEIGAQWRARYGRALTDGPFREEYQLPDGRWLELSLNPIIQAGRQVGVSVFGKDISDHKEALVALRERETSLREAEFLAQSGSASYDVATDTSTWSEGLYRITGRDPSTPPPNWEDRTKLYTPESYARLVAATQQAAVTGEPFDIEVQIVRPDGTLRWTRARGAASRNELGEVQRLSGTLQDITEQKLAEMKLGDSEERFRATFEQAAIGIIHVSFEGELLRCNERFAETLGYSSAELVGRRIQEFTPTEHIAQIARKIKELVEGQVEVTSLEKPYIRRDGSLVWVRLTSSLQRDGEGRRLHMITFVEDISGRKAAEENLSAAANELREKEFRYRTVFQTSVDALCVSGLNDGKLIDVNKAFLDITGYERGEVIGRSSLELGLWANPHERQIIVEELREKSACRDLEILFRRKSGETF